MKLLIILTGRNLKGISFTNRIDLVIVKSYEILFSCSWSLKSTASSIPTLFETTDHTSKSQLNQRESNIEHHRKNNNSSNIIIPIRSKIGIFPQKYETDLLQRSSIVVIKIEQNHNQPHIHHQQKSNHHLNWKRTNLGQHSNHFKLHSNYFKPLFPWSIISH